MGPLARGKTCKYCSRCEWLMVHQDELEAELANSFSRIAPEVMGKEYIVLGTVDRKVWKSGLQGAAASLPRCSSTSQISRRPMTYTSSRADGFLLTKRSCERERPVTISPAVVVRQAGFQYLPDGRRKYCVQPLEAL